MASTVLWKGEKKAKIGFAADLMTEARWPHREKIQSETWRFCPIPHRNKIFRSSCGLTRVVESASPMPCRIAGSLGDLHRAEIPSKSATRLVREEGGSRTVTAVKTSPHPTTSPNPAGKYQRQDRAFSRQHRRLGSRGRLRWFRSLSLAGCFGSGFSRPLSFTHSLSLCLSLCFSDR